ncbi:MAG: four-carbon acid sugar kinase family protein [Candidatus Bathyarchaeia archaeon]|nr:four-carbon acid sugar kinase family protein [Candidatus Bathyarchaeota archaeon]
MRALVVADDLTGACDAGIKFVESGLSTLVLTRPVENIHGGYDVLAVDTETRNMDAQEAYRIVKEVSERFKSSFEIYYKKIDSTMRGHVGAEVEAMLEGLNFRAAIVSPAYPENARTVVGGYLFVNGELLEKTEFATPGGTGSYIPHLLGKETSGEADRIDLSLMRRGFEAVRDRIEKLIRRGIRIIVADAVSRRDLEALVEACSGMDEGLLLCGSAGLAEELARRIAVKEGGLLMVSGSLKRETLDQIEELERRLPVKVFKLDPQEILKGEPSTLLLESLLRELRLRGITVLASALSKTDGIPGAEETARKALSRTVKRILGEVKTDLIAIGGETATSILSELHVHSLRPMREVGEGIPLSVIPDGEWEGVRVVTKAGGFGSAEALVDLVKKLTTRRRNL